MVLNIVYVSSTLSVSGKDPRRVKYKLVVHSLKILDMLNRIKLIVPSINGASNIKYGQCRQYLLQSGLGTSLILFAV